MHGTRGLTGPTGPAGGSATDAIPAGPTGLADPKVIQLAKRAAEVIEITELKPASGAFAGKCVKPDNTIAPYPEREKWWWQAVSRVPATIPHLFAYHREARKRNICLIRGAPANLERQPTLRQKAGMFGRSDRGDHGFLDVPTRLMPFDLDGVPIAWLDDPERAVRAAVAQLGWESTSFVWFLSATCGLECEEHDAQKRWTGRIIDGRLRARIIFITARALDMREAIELTSIARVRAPELDRTICRTVQPNYIAHPLWVEHPGRDVLGEIPTIGYVSGTHEFLAVPGDLTHRARWAKAQGRGSDIADHPDTEAAVRGIGSDGKLRAHLMSAVVHLLRANPPPDVVSFIDHSLDIAGKLQRMVVQQRETIESNLAAHGRHWSEVTGHVAQMDAWALWCLNHPGILHAKTIKLSKDEQPETHTATREGIFARVERTIECAYANAADEQARIEQIRHFKRFLSFDDTGNLCYDLNKPLNRRARRRAQRHDADIKKRTERAQSVELLIAPPGSRKSTLIRAWAVRFVTEHPGKTVVILVPRHQLGDEQIKQLRQEHPDGNYKAAIWRGRHADNPDDPDPDHPDKFRPMCKRSKDVEVVEMHILDVEGSMCKRGEGKKAVKCPHYEKNGRITCAYQQQNQITANIWFAAHECAVHTMPKVFGDVGWVIFDESPLDAFMFGLDIDKPVKLELDELHTPLNVDPAKLGRYTEYNCLMKARETLYQALDKLPVGHAAPWEALKPYIRTALGGSVPRESLDPIISMAAASSIGIGGHQSPDHRKMYGSTWRGKVKPDIWPNMSRKELEAKLLEAAINQQIKKETVLWKLIEDVDENRIYHDIHELPKEQIKTLLESAAVNMPSAWDAYGAVTAVSRRIIGEVPTLLELTKIPIRRGIPYGRISIHRGKEGRFIRMVGLNKLAKRWDAPTLICDATGDARLLKAIFPQIIESEPHGWEQLPRPPGVQLTQCVDRSISKWAVAVESKSSKGPKTKSGRQDLDRRIKGARRLYAAVLMKAVEYGGGDVGVITYKSTKEEWTRKNYFIPDWLKILHWGDLTGTNDLQHVRALFVIGRPQASPEAVTQQAEALFGVHIPNGNTSCDRSRGAFQSCPTPRGISAS
jgi:hypothetical protein